MTSPFRSTSPRSAARSSILVLVLVLALGSAAPSGLRAGDGLAGADWPHWRGPNYNGIARETIPLPLPEQLPVAWTADVGTGFSTVSVAGYRVLTMGNEDEHDLVSCLDARNGELLWRHAYPCELDPLYYEGGPGGTPAIHEGSVYTLSKKGHAFRLDLESGEVVWSRDLLADHALELPEWSFAASPFVEEDHLLLNVGGAGISLSLETGETLWLSNPGPSGYATPVPFQHESSGTTHLLFGAKALFGIDAVEGATRWELPWSSSRDVNAADPVLVGERFLISSTSGAALLEFAEGAAEPTPVWEQRDLRWYFNPGVLVGGHVYSIHGTTHRPTDLVCTDAATGETLWYVEGRGSGGVIAAGEIVILFDLGKLTLFHADPGGFRPILEQEILEGKCWTTPVLAHGRIYCRTAEGTLASVRVR